jgi:hypothetical protein
MHTVSDRHAFLQSPSALEGYSDYAELATFHLRRAIWDLNRSFSEPLSQASISMLMSRLIFTLTCVEASAPHVPRYDIGADMPMAGRDQPAAADESQT